MWANPSVRGIGLMLLAVSAYALGDTAMKFVMQEMSMWQAMCVRALPASLILALFVQRARGWSALKSPREAWLILARSLLELLAALAFLGALRHMPVANLTAIMQALPLCVTLAAALVFGEGLGWPRVLAIVVGFLGVLIVVRPGPEGFDLWALLGLGSMALVVLRELVTRQISTKVSPFLTALGAVVLVGLPGGLGTFAVGWQPMGVSSFAVLMLGAVLQPLAFVASIKALQMGEIGVTAPFRYTQLLWATGFGYMVFGHMPDAWTLVGAGLTVASGAFTLVYEAYAHRARGQRVVPQSA